MLLESLTIPLSKQDTCDVQLLSFNVLLDIIVNTHLSGLFTPRQFHSQIVIIRDECLLAFAEMKNMGETAIDI